MTSNADPGFTSDSPSSTLTSTGLESTFDDLADDPSSWINIESTVADERIDVGTPFDLPDTVSLGVGGVPSLSSPSTVTAWNDSDRTESWNEAAGSRRAPEIGRAVPDEEAVPGFRIEEELGRGGMGVVYKAWHIELKRYVALKMIRDDRLGSPQMLARFTIEAEALARLDHPNIVRIFQIGKRRGVPFVTLEYLEGGTLAKRAAGTPQAIDEATALLITLARAVHAAHLAGILHRDLKPSNILFGRDQNAKITDFGLAKRIDEQEDGETVPGQVIGTPSYMAPEQAHGWNAEIDRSVDIYSLGAILYELLTGRPPHKGANVAETCQLVLNTEPLPPSRLRPKIPIDLETICLKCLERAPRKRYADAAALADDLQRFQDGKPILARRTPFWERGWKQAKRRPLTTLFLALALVGVGASLAYFRYARIQALVAENREHARVFGVRRSADATLFQLETLAEGRQWDELYLAAEHLLTTLETEPRLLDLRRRALLLRDRARNEARAEKAAQAAKNARDEARANLQRFVALHDETLFRQANFTGLEPSEQNESTIQWARKGLEVYGVADAAGAWTLRPLPAELERRERELVERDFYELLMILAETVASAPGVPVESRAIDALRLIDQADRVHAVPTRASRLQRAEALSLQGDLEASKRALAKAEEIKPADPADLFLTGRWLSKQGDWSGATAMLEEAAHRQPDHFWSHFQLAIAHVKTFQPSKAQLCLNTCLQQKPDCVWVYLFRGIASTGAAAALESRGSAGERNANALLEPTEADYQSALAQVGDGSESGDLRYILLFHRGITRLARQQTTAAEKDLRAAVDLNDRRCEAYNGLGKVFQKQGRTAEAFAHFSKAIERRPTRGELYRDRGLLVFADESATAAQCRAAARDFEEAIRRESADGKFVAQNRAYQSALLRRAGEFQEALDAAEAALRIDNRLMMAHQTRVLCLLETKHYDELLQSCLVALEFQPTAQLYELSGLAREARKDHLGAVADYTYALRLRPDDALLRCRRGWSNLAANAHAPALDDFNATLRLEPGMAEAFVGRALARVRLGDPRAAIDDAEAALQHDKTHWRVSYRAAMVFALAANHALTKTPRPVPADIARATRYQDRAVALLQTTLDRLPPAERPSFLKETLPNERALQSLGKRLRPFLASISK